MMPMRSEDGAVEAYLGVQVDVTAQVLAAAREDSNGARLHTACPPLSLWQRPRGTQKRAIDAGTGVYVREACDAVEDPAEAEKRRLKDLLASWRAAQSGARPAVRVPPRAGLLRRRRVPSCAAAQVRSWTRWAAACPARARRPACPPACSSR